MNEYFLLAEQYGKSNHLRRVIYSRHEIVKPLRTRASANESLEGIFSLSFD